ncbi:hypothetical protein GCM10010909_06930 [Acidocella aquatica]|uniref:Uncharacterized protein n=1 Tax=Acidocella aquatica TaxID=1922313 RepID=A0ABQ6A441_9PROT|nr:hypothetical protein [Acidocella aquatica]GLR66015.1 hypothetical protein GCM10010909_06930 [Acidocella aquatica]
MIADNLVNPFNHLQELELPHEIVVMENWTEHYFFAGYDIEAGFGACVHVGRLPADPTIWRAVIQIYLPGEKLLVAKYHGRDGHARGPGAGPFKASCIDPFRLWAVEFDGAAFSTTRQEIMREVLRDGPAEPVKFHMLLEAAGPIFGRTDDHGEGRSSSTFHSEQICRMRGHIVYQGKRIELSGTGVRDHSSGPRDYGPVIGDIWFHGCFPSGKIVQTQVVRFESFEIKTAYIFRGDGTPLEMVEIIEHPHVNSRDAGPQSLAADPLSEAARNFKIVLKSRQGIEVIEGELQHSHAITYFAPVEEFLGTDLTRPDGIQMCEAPVKLRWNGENGSGIRERVARTGTLFACS